MKTRKSLFAIAFILISICIQAQTASGKSEQTVARLGYHPEIPAPNSYAILKNTKGELLSDSILLKINFYRKADENFIWKVSENLELLIFPIHASKEKGKE